MKYKLSRLQSSEIEKSKKKNKKNKKKVKNKSNHKWVIQTTIFAFIASLIFSLISEVTIPNSNVFWGIILVIIFILMGIFFDILGIAVASADIKPFHSMNSKKIKEAKIAVYLIKNAPRVTSFCNDVVGDICGIISGSAGVIIANSLANTLNCNVVVVTLSTTSLIAGLTIGGKALGKSFAINKSEMIILWFSKAVTFLVPKIDCESLKLLTMNKI